MWIYWRVNQFFPLQAAFWVNSRALPAAPEQVRDTARSRADIRREDPWRRCSGQLVCCNWGFSLWAICTMWCPPVIICEKKAINYRYTSSTAQGGGGSFRNRKPIGEVGCCESRMAERIHWWTERWLQWSPHSQLLDVVWCSAVVCSCCCSCSCSGVDVVEVVM